VIIAHGVPLRDGGANLLRSPGTKRECTIQRFLLPISQMPVCALKPYRSMNPLVATSAGLMKN
jgi:hypothetical protein